MSIHRIAWRPMAVADLDQIVAFIARDNPDRAESFGHELQAKTLPLARHPRLGHAGRPGLPPGVRELIVHRNYIVFYRILPADGTVEILRVKHAARQTP